MAIRKTRYYHIENAWVDVNKAEKEEKVVSTQTLLEFPLKYGR